MARAGRSLIPALLLIAGLGLLAFYFRQGAPEPDDPFRVGTGATPTQRQTLTAAVTSTETGSASPPAIVTATLLPSSTPTTQPSSTPTVSPTIPATVPATLSYDSFQITDAQRFGLTGFTEDITVAHSLDLPFASYTDWHVHADPPRPPNVSFWQMIRLHDGEIYTPRADIDQALAANPGATWLIGNEPDVAVQDNTTPQRYAHLYHELYTYIKGRDPTATIAIGGVSQPTPLRRAYLDIVLDTYLGAFGQPMPIDVWNVHAFVLREDAGAWGIGIPPGMDDNLAMLYEIEDHDNLEILQRNIIDFREWMASRGYADRPLLISEYGFLMPYDFGFSPEEVATFMNGTFDFFLTARNDTGLAVDGGRLVQWWLWFILSGPGDEFVESYLYDRDSGQLTALGRTYGKYVRTHLPAHMRPLEP